MANVYDLAVQELLTAYFSEYSITSLSRAFDRIMTDFSRREILTTKTSDFPEKFVKYLLAQELVKYLLAFLLTTLVEHGQMVDTGRYIGTAGKITSSICEMHFFKIFCQKLGQHHDFQKWTFLILYLISALRQGKFLFVPEVASRLPAELVDLDLSNVKDNFLSNVILLLYGFLMTRLVISAMNVPGEKERFNVECCMFVTLISFYYDYVGYTKNFDTSASFRHWELMLQQVDKLYLQKGRFFISLQFEFDLKTYFDQDNVGGFYGCINKHFLNRYKKTITSLDMLGEESPSIDKCIDCIMDTDLNDLSMIYNRWFRYIVYNQFWKDANSDIQLAKEVIADSYGGVRDAIMLGYGVYSNLYSDKFPTPTRLTGVAVGIIAFTGKLYYSFIKNRLKWGFKQLAAGTVYAFFKKDLLPPKYISKFEKPRAPAHLIWTRSSDGTYSVIYNKTPLPSVNIMTEDQPFLFMHGGAKGSSGPKRQQGSTKKDSELESLKKALKKGHLKNDLAPEMQIYLKKKMNLTTDMIGGAGIENSLSDQLLAEENMDDPLPFGYTRTILDIADDEAFYQEDGDIGRLILPMPKLQKEALENAAFVEVTEPALEKEKPPTKEDALPPQLPTHDIHKPISIPTHIKNAPTTIPPPPVDPAAALPTVSDTARERLLNKTMAKSDRYVKVKFRNSRRRR